MPGRIRFYHKTTCSTSRQAKRLLDDAGVEYETVLYMDDPPSLAELKGIARILEQEPKQLMRPKEAIEAGLDTSRDHSDDEILACVAKHPAALQRPIIVVGDKRAVIGRPLDKVEGLIRELTAAKATKRR